MIPANYGSEYSYLPDKEGIMGQVFLPGPVVNFGDESDYKYSKIHNWLSKHQNRIFRALTAILAWTVHLPEAQVRGGSVN